MFEHLKSRAEAAQSEHERARAQLFRDAENGNWEKLYSDDEHQRRERVLNQERAAKLDAVIEALRQEVEGANKDLAALDGGDVTNLVSGEELAAASAKKPFVEDDLGGLPEGELEGKLRAVLDGGDKAAIFAYWRAGSAWLQSVSSRPGGGPQGLSEVLGEMRDFLAGTERLARAERARDKIEAAGEVEMLASNLKVGARTAADAWMNRQRETARRQRAGA